jgi:hypothetical protein
MGSANPPKDSFDSAEMDLMEQAFNSVWDTVAMHDPSRDSDKNEELKNVIRKKLFALARQGVTDGQILRDLVLEIGFFSQH